METQFIRTELVIGQKNSKKLQDMKVIVFGIGGVGGFVCDALARAGVGTIDIVDDDRVCLSNINRQLVANHETIGRQKVDVMEEHLKTINPNIQVKTFQTFYLPTVNEDQFDFESYDYIVDCIDTISAKIGLVVCANRVHVPVISSMGAGNKMDPARFEVSDIYKTSVCPLARVMRHELKKRRIKKLKVVYSKEKPLVPLEDLSTSGDTKRRAIPGSTPFVPPVAGYIIASEVIKDLIDFDAQHRE